jgi:AAA-like domain
MMLSPITAMTDNLLWTRGGSVWATWRLAPLAYGYTTVKGKDQVRAYHTALLRGLRGEALLLGVCTCVDPTSVVKRMIEGIDLDRRPEWTAECEATLDMLEGIDLGQRAFWLSVPLPNKGANWIGEPVRAGLADVKDRAAMPRTGPNPRQVQARLRQADLVRKAIPEAFEARPASVAEHVWLQVHAQQRGLGVDLAVPGADTCSAEAQLLTSPAAIPSPVLDPCGQTDNPAGRPGMPNILGNRFMKIINPDLGEASYQTMLTVAQTPSGGIAFPGAEWIGRIDECAATVDWALRLTIRGRAEVTDRNRRANRNLADQLDQREGDDRAGAESHLHRVAESLARYQELMDSDELEVETEVTAIFVVAAATAEQVKEEARALTGFFAAADFKLSTDPTAQEALWWACLPGTPTSRVVRQLSQITPARHLAAAVPVVSNALGDTGGSLFALEISNSRPQPVLVDLRGSGGNLEVGMAVGFAGEMGSGKSVAMKDLAMDAVDRGASLMVVDRTKLGEWTKALESLPGAVFLDVSEHASWSVDPLRLFDPHTAARVAQSFYTVLLNVDATSTEGTALSDVLDPKYLTDHGITSSGSLLRHLSAGCGILGADQLAAKMRVFARKDFGRAVFDDTLEALDLTAPAIVFRTNLLEVPDADELNHAHRFAQMSLEKIFGRAVYTLIMAIARHRCFADSTRLGVFAVDEAWQLTSSPESLNELRVFVRDGRKHLAMFLFGSQDAEADLGDEVLRGLIAFRVLMRHRDAGLATRGLRWLQALAPGELVDPDLLAMITTDTSPVDGADGVRPERRGECLVRDFQGRIGRCKVLLPAVAHRAEAILTTPAAAGPGSER